MERMKKKTPFRTAYTEHDPAAYGTPNGEPSMTQQQFKEECDVNVILARFQKTGVIDHVAKFAPVYGEHTGTDYAEAMNIIANAKTMFSELPAATREHFHNDPGEFLDFANQLSESDTATLVNLGMIDEGSETARAFRAAEVAQEERKILAQKEAPAEHPAEAE